MPIFAPDSSLHVLTNAIYVVNLSLPPGALMHKLHFDCDEAYLTAIVKKYGHHNGMYTAVAFDEFQVRPLKRNPFQKSISWSISDPCLDPLLDRFPAHVWSSSDPYLTRYLIHVF